MSIKIAILVSGRGSNMEAILQAVRSGQLDVSVELVVSNRPEAPALEIARNFGVTTQVVAHKGYTRLEHERKVVELLWQFGVEWVVLAGYMRVLTGEFLSHFKDERGFYRVVNIHPSLLPAFSGTCGYEEAFAYGVRVSGITVHLVDEKVDHGPILAQECFPRLPDDTLETFKARGLAVEHRLYPSVLQQIAKGGPDLLPVGSTCQVQLSGAGRQME